MAAVSCAITAYQYAAVPILLVTCKSQVRRDRRKRIAAGRLRSSHIAVRMTDGALSTDRDLLALDHMFVGPGTVEPRSARLQVSTTVPTRL